MNRSKARKRKTVFYCTTCERGVGVVQGSYTNYKTESGREVVKRICTGCNSPVLYMRNIKC